MPKRVDAPEQPSRAATVGVISDTHGVLPTEVLEAFQGVDLIVHAGDVGAERILHELNAIAPVIAVAGNTDRPYPTWPLHRTASTVLAGVHVVVSHIGHRTTPPGPALMVTGHTHRPEVLERNGVLHVNPGSTSVSRTGDGLGTVAIVEIAREGLEARIVELSHPVE